VTSEATVAAPTAAAPRESVRRRSRGGQLALWLFAAPALIVYTYFLAVPTLQTVLYSITDWDGYSADFAWVGAGNYADIATNDSQFRNALVNSLQFTLVVAVAQTVLSLALAVLLLRNTRGAVLLRALFFFPAILSSVAVAFVWKFVLDPQVGPLEPVLAAVGLGGGQYLAAPGTAVLWLALVQVWAHAGQLMVVYIAGLQQIPLPLILPTGLIVLAYTTVQSFKAFDLVLGLGGNPPNPPLDILATRIYGGFADSQFGYAAAESVVFLALIALITWLQRRLVGRDLTEDAS
jgi:raffinose/stachyose/melibiose transport system permease protein